LRKERSTLYPSSKMSTRPEWLNAAFCIDENSTRAEIARTVLCQLDRKHVELPLPRVEPARSRELFRRSAAKRGLTVGFRPDADARTAPTDRICRPSNDGAA
jgi:hypothetical protein